MSTKLIRSTFLLGLALSFGFYLKPALGQEQHPKSGTTKATKSRGEAGGKDENIKQDRKANDPNANIEAPPEKGGAKTRQAACRIHIDNRTPWYIAVYTDGAYRGEMSPFGDSYGYVGCGNTTFYGRATFTDGSTQAWGPQVYYVFGTFTWSLTP